MDPASVAEMVCELYDARPEAKEYLEFWLNPDIKKELEKYKVKIHRLFYTPSGKQRKRPTITSIKKELKYFSSLCIDPEIMSELYLFLCQTDIQWVSERKNPAPSVKSAQSNLDTCRKYIEASGLEDIYSIRLERLQELLDEEKKRGEQRRGYGWGRWLW